MLKRIIAIAFIFACASAAWMILGATIFSRTYDSDQNLEGRVASLWGAPHTRSPPVASCERKVPKTTETVEKGKKKSVTEQLTVTDFLPVESSRIDVALDLDYRQKGLLWYSTYKVGFAGLYTFRNTTDQDKVTFTMKFPTDRATYDDLVFRSNNAPVALAIERNSRSGTAAVRPVGPATLM